MKKEIHPNYRDVVFLDTSSDYKFMTKSTIATEDSITWENGEDNQSIGGLKIVCQNGWFAARPSGTENLYKIYLESFLGEAHLALLEQEARAIVDGFLTSYL